MATFELRIVALVLRQYPAVGALKHIGPIISTFLGPSSSLSLCEACTFDSTELLDWIWASSCTSASKRTPRWTLTNYLRSEPYYTQWQFQQSLVASAKGGHLKMIQWIFDHFSGYQVPSEVVTAAAGNGHFLVLKFLLDHDTGRDCKHETKQVELADDDWIDSVPVMATGWSGPGNAVRWGGHAIRNATRAKLYSIARRLYDKTPHQSDERETWTIVECAVNAGAIEFAESLLPPNRRIMEYMHSGSTPEALRWIFDAGHEEDLINNQDAAAMAFRVAGYSGDLELTQRIAQLRNPRKRNTRWPTEWEWTLESACSKGDLPMVEWMMKHPLGKKVCKRLKDGDDFTLTDLLREAAKSGNIEVLEYVHRKGFTDENASALVSAAREGHVNCMEWLFKRTPVYTHLHSACVSTKLQRMVS